MSKNKSALVVEGLKVAVEGMSILRGVDLTVRPGEIHAVMGPNGSGKSTLAYTLAGHPGYQIEGGTISIDDQLLNEQTPDERAQQGLFLAFQYPIEIPGVKVHNFLRLAYEARFADQPDKKFPSVLAFRQHLAALAADLDVKPDLLKRGLNEGFSGGEKKRLEILQMAVLEPRYAILDETDSGLDVDAIKAVAHGVRKVVKKYRTGIIVITHYQRILKYLKPDFVHVVVNGAVVQRGDKKLAQELEKEGYQQYGSLRPKTD